MLDLSTLSVPKPIRPSSKGPGLGQGPAQGPGLTPGYPPLYPSHGITSKDIDDRNDHNHSSHPPVGNPPLLFSGTIPRPPSEAKDRYHRYPSPSPHLPENTSVVHDAAVDVTMYSGGMHSPTDQGPGPGQGLVPGQEQGQGQGQATLISPLSPLRRRNSSRFAQQQPLRRWVHTTLATHPSNTP